MRVSKTTLNKIQKQQLIDVAKAQAQRVMGKIPVLGAVAWLMMQQAGARHTLLSELDCMRLGIPY